MATQLTPFFGGQQAPFQPQQQPQQQQGADPRLLLGLAQGAQGFLQGGQRGGLGAALLGLGSGALGGVAQGQFLQQKQAQQQQAAQAAAQQQALENQRAQQEAQRKAAADARGIVEFNRTSGLDERKEQRLIGSAQSAQDIARQNVELGRGNLAARRQELAQRSEPLVEVFSADSPSGSIFVPRSEAAGQPGAGSFAGTGLTPGKAEELTSSAGGLRLAQTKLSALRDDLAANPQRAGAIGSVNKALQTAGGIARDLADVIPGVGAIAEAMIGPVVATESQEVQDFLSDPSLEANQAAANSLAYALALSRKQGKRVTVQDVSTAKDDLKITGLKSSKQVVARMDELLREIDQGIGLIEQRVATAGPGGLPPAQAQPGSGQVLQFDAQGNPVQ